VFPHEHFSVIGQGRAFNDPVRMALQQAGSVDAFPSNTPITAIESLPENGNVWEMASWRENGRTGTLWHASRAETPDSVAPKTAVKIRSSF